MSTNASTMRAHHNHLPQCKIALILWSIVAVLCVLAPCTAMSRGMLIQGTAAHAPIQMVQWSAPLSAGLTPEQLIFALRKRELSASHNPECTTLHNKVQRLRRAERRAPAEQQSQFAQDLAKAQQRQQKLRCPQAPKL